MKLRPPSYLVLGMLRIGLRSGYEIKRGADRSTKHFWPMSLAQVYPELAKLEEAGLITGRDDPHGGRARRAYEITEKGDAALLDWLRDPHDEPPQVRDERLVRLFFADALPRADQIALVRRLRESHEEEVARIEEEVIPVASAAEQAGTIFPHALARLSMDVFATIAHALEDLERRLSDERVQRLSHPSRPAACARRDRGLRYSAAAAASSPTDRTSASPTLLRATKRQ